VTGQRIELDLRNPATAREQLTQVWAWIRTMLAAGHWLVLVVRLATRSDAQNRLLHSRIRDVSKHLRDWRGVPMDDEDWKRMLIAAWCRVHNEPARMVPALDGHGFEVLYRRTSKLTRAECADLSEYILAWGTEQGVNWCAASLAEDVPPRRARAPVDQETGEILTEETAA
jgi:hypothetical protein